MVAGNLEKIGNEFYWGILLPGPELESHSNALYGNLLNIAALWRVDRTLFINGLNPSLYLKSEFHWIGRGEDRATQTEMEIGFDSLKITRQIPYIECR